MRVAARLLAVVIFAAAGAALAQEKHLIDPTPPGSLNPKPLPPLKNPNAPSTPAKELFARKSTPFPGPPRYQVGLDVDIWLTPMPDHVQSREEREFGSATDVVALDLLDVDPEVWTHRHTELIRTAAQDPAVIRILVNAAIKKALCREAGADRAWLFKVRPWYGHAEHFHVQIGCPADSADCKPPTPPPPRDGCDNELDFWFKESTLHPPPTKPKPPLTLADLPPACRQIVKAP